MQRACVNCGQAFTPHSKSVRHCTACRPANRARQTYDAAYQRNRAIVLAGDPPCRWCGAPADTADHLVPVARGGTNEIANLAPACEQCNKRRGADPGWRPRDDRERQRAQACSGAGKRPVVAAQRTAPRLT
jgi:5-methylcytosine-specific restriction endonuclease McrA